jgi:hypothetical protein
MVSQAATLTFRGAEMAPDFLKTSEKPYFPTINAWFARFNPGGLKIFAQIIPRLKIPKGFHHSAQGCHPMATLGQSARIIFEP